MKTKALHKTVDLRNMKDKASNHFSYLLYVILYLVGLLLSVSLFYFDESELVKHIINASQIPISAYDVLDLIKKFCTTNVFTVLISFVSGFCAIGKPIMMINMICNAIQIGLYCLQYTMHESKNSLLFTLSIYIPAAVIAGICVIISNVQSSFLSTDIYNNVIHSVGKIINIRTYLSRYVLIIFILLFAIVYLFLASMLFIRIVN